MKKTISIVLSAVLALGVLAGCGAKTPTTPTTAPTAAPTAAPTTPAATGFAKIGLGLVTSVAKSKDVDPEKGATAQVDTVMVAAAFDKDGKVLSVIIDNAQTKVAYDKDMKLTSDVAAPIKTKLELGNDYGMKAATTIGKEWFEQAGALGEWMIGKTVAEVKALKVKVKDDNHKNVPDVPELTSLVTITVEDYIKGLEKAYANAQEVKAGAVKLGLGQGVSIAKSKGEDADKGATAQVDTTIVVTALDKDGKVAGTVIDVAQTKVAYDVDGKVTSDKTAVVKSKQELGTAYNMKAASKIGKEWFEQANALAAWTVGKSVADVTGMKLVEGKADAADLKTTVTVSVQGYLDAFKEAAEKAK